MGIGKGENLSRGAALCVLDLVVFLTFELYSFVTLIKFNQKFREKKNKNRKPNLMYNKYLGSF